MIGCGLISHAHGRAALKSGQDIRFVSCASRTAESAMHWAQTYCCASYYLDHREMLEKEQLDGVVIATWPSSHCELITAALDAGVRHVLCEKALVTSVGDALAVWHAAGRAGAVVQEAFMYRHHAAIATARAIVEAGELGAVDWIHGDFHMFDPETADAEDASRGWRQVAAAGGGVIHDFACYPVDAANLFAGGLPVRAFATGSRSAKFGVINRLFAHIQYAGGCVATVSSSRRSCLRQSLRIGGSKAVLDVPFAWSAPGCQTLTKTASPGFLAEEVTRYPVACEAPHDGSLSDFPVFTRQLCHFANVIRGVERPVLPLAASVVNAMVLDALGKSFEEGLPVAIDVPPDVRNVLQSAA